MLSGVELSEVFAVSPKRSAGNATLEALARAFVKPGPRRRKNVALVAWGDGDGASYVVGALVAAEVPAGGAGLRLELAREGGQVAAGAPPSSPIRAAKLALAFRKTKCIKSWHLL